jgi:putative cofactor-binding repeat protein
VPTIRDVTHTKRYFSLASGDEWHRLEHDALVPFHNTLYSRELEAADGDNITETLQAKLTAAAPAVGGSGLVTIPAGTFLVDTVLSVPAGVTVQGVGRGATVLKWADDTGSMPGSGVAATDGSGLLTLDTVSQVEIRNLTVDCNKANQTGTVNLNCIYVTDCTDIVVDNCTLKNAEAQANGDFGNGIRVNGPVVQPVRMTFTRNTIHDVTETCAIVFSNNGDHCIIAENLIYDCTYGVDFSTGSWNVVANNVFRDLNSGALNDAIHFEYGNKSSITGNVIDNCSIGIAGNYEQCTITGNYMLGKNTSTGAGIKVQNDTNGKNVTTGNRIDGFLVGIDHQLGSNDLYAANIIQGCPTGVKVAGASNRVLISGNSIDGATTDAVNLGASTSNCFVDGNHIGGSSGGTTDDGTGNLFSDNMAT